MATEEAVRKTTGLGKMCFVLDTCHQYSAREETFSCVLILNLSQVAVTRSCFEALELFSGVLALFMMSNGHNDCSNCHLLQIFPRLPCPSYQRP